LGLIEKLSGLRKPTEATTIEVDELDVVNRGNRGAVDELSDAN
jgi:hypothetical protein